MTKMNVLMVGTGEYTTGYVPGSGAAADKKAGVVGITLFDLKRRGLLGQLHMAGTNGRKFPEIRQHLQRAIAETYRDMDVSFCSYPDDQVERDPFAYRLGLAALKPGDAVIVFTPDDTHFKIASEAIHRGCHVLIAKPMVKSVEEHASLVAAARQRNVLVAMEVHKRWDPIYVDARDRISRLGEFSFFQAYMSQPKSQLDTFRAWAGQSSDISYYLNAHHIDFNVWACASMARPVSVRASASTGVAHSMGITAEDTITLLVDWENLKSGNRAIGIYTSSWIAPKADVHSQQRFHYMGHAGEISIDQAHRGYALATDLQGYQSLNPLFMKYTPDSDGYFAGHPGYGYRSFEDFLRAADRIRQGQSTADDFRGRLPTAADTLLVTAILQAGRISLDNHGQSVRLTYSEQGEFDKLEA